MEWAYMRDMLLRELETIVKDVQEGTRVLLEDTIFYPLSGGVDHDTGRIISEDGGEYKVIRVTKDGDMILHEVDREGLQPGMHVRLVPTGSAAGSSCACIPLHISLRQHSTRMA